MNSPATPTPEYIPRRELCKRLGISPSTVYRQGLQEFAVAIGGAIRYDWHAILQACQLQPDTEGDEEP